MFYKKFIIKKYKAISQPLTIKIRQKGVQPIIGINECGKTTILKAILAFDYRNDHDNKDYHHLNDLGNHYTYDQDTVICAEIGYDEDEFTTIFATLEQKLKQTRFMSSQYLDQCNVEIDQLKDIIKTQPKVSFARKINAEYNHKHIYDELDFKGFDFSFRDPALTDRFCKELLENLPNLIYYDDFTNKVANEINITSNANDYSVRTMQRLFDKTFPDK